MTSFPSVLESVDDLSNEQIIDLLTLAEHIERDKVLLNQENSLKKPLIYTLFLEDSTRTKLSFATSAHRIGAHWLDFPMQTSSMNKGENLEETLLTLKNHGADAVVIRAKESGILKKFKNAPPLKIINGGDGINEHPTQALLDFYLLQKLFPNLYQNHLNSLTIGIAGDIIHSRVAHSLMQLLPRFGFNIALFGPEYFIPNDFQNKYGNKIKIYTDKRIFLKDINILYLLRIQLERHQGSLLENIDDLKMNYLNNFGFMLNDFNNKEFKHLKIMHPGPVNVGLELDEALLKSGFYLGLDQVKFSIPVRMALLLKQLNNNDGNIENAKKIEFSLL